MSMIKIGSRYSNKTSDPLPCLRQHLRHRRFRGTTIVEFALVAPMLFLITALLVQFAMLGNAVLAMSQVSREGARSAAVGTNENTIIIQTMQKACVGTMLNSALINSSTVSIAPNDIADREPGVLVTVTLTYDLRRVMFLPTTFFGVSLVRTVASRSSSMRIEGQTGL